MMARIKSTAEEESAEGMRMNSFLFARSPRWTGGAGGAIDATDFSFIPVHPIFSWIKQNSWDRPFGLSLCETRRRTPLSVSRLGTFALPFK
jgi:hypothetical protein